MIGVDYQGQGFATEAGQAMTEWLVGKGIIEITAHTHTEHLACQRVASAIGLNATGETDEDGEEIWAISAPSS